MTTDVEPVFRSRRVTNQRAGESRVVFLDGVVERGCDLLRVACERDLEGIVAKWARGTYQTDGRGTSWLKIKNLTCSQTQGRHELLAVRRPEGCD